MGKRRLTGWILAVGLTGQVAAGAAEVRLDRDFLGSVVEKIPPAPFGKAGQYRGSARAFRLAGIDPKYRRILVACEVSGEFRPPVASALKKGFSSSANESGGWKAFTFDVKAGVKVEAGSDGAPKFAVDVDEVKRRDLDGVAGLLARALGSLFDDLVTQIADGKAALLSAKVNAEVLKRVGAFQSYGVLREIDYAADEVVLKFDVTRLRSEGVVGYLYKDPKPGAVALYRWANPRRGTHFYTTDGQAGNLPALGFIYEGPAGYLPPGPGPGVIAWHRWRGRAEWFYTTDPKGEGLPRLGNRPEALAGYLFDPANAPPPGASALYRFVDPRSGAHFFTTHPHAEFAK